MNLLGIQICQKIKDAGGQAYYVGGYVRDFLLGLNPKDLDIEVFGLHQERLCQILQECGSVKVCGESFSVFKVNNEIDVSPPRRERKVGAGHKGFDVDFDPFMSIKEAASRRDYTINTIYYDPIEDNYEDPYGGIGHLRSRILEVVSDRFSEDPLRVLRGMQFVSRFDLRWSNRTRFCCERLKSCMKELAKERVYDEFYKWAEKSETPSAGLKFLAETGWIENFPELNNLRGCVQSEKWHPEGDVWTHTLHVVDEMRKLNGSDHIDLFAAFFHDIGKTLTTVIHEDGRITAHGHDTHGAIMTQKFFEKYFGSYLQKDLDKICKIVDLHMYRPQPVGYFKSKTVRKFMLKKLGCISIERFERIIRADAYGRPPIPKELSEDMERFLKECKEYVPPMLKGQDLIDRGWKPGPSIGHKLRELESLHIGQGLDRDELLSTVKVK